MVVVDTHRIPKDLREPAREAEKHFEWTAQRKKNGYLMRSPGGTRTFFLAFKTNNPVLEAKKFRLAMADAALNEGGRIQDIALQTMQERDIDVQVECDGCGQTFITVHGYNAHTCPGGPHPLLGIDGEEREAITQPDQERPAEGHTAVVSEDSEPVRGSFGSGSMSNKEEDVVVKGEKRGSYRKSAKVKPGLARVIYEEMRDSPPWKTEAHSAYANRIAERVEKRMPAPEQASAPEPAEAAPSATDEEVAAMASELATARETLGRITEALGIDMSALVEAQELREKNRLLQENLGTLSELLDGIKKI